MAQKPQTVVIRPLSISRKKLRDNSSTMKRRWGTHKSPLETGPTLNDEIKKTSRVTITTSFHRRVGGADSLPWMVMLSTDLWPWLDVVNVILSFWKPFEKQPKRKMDISTVIKWKSLCGREIEYCALCLLKAKQCPSLCICTSCEWSPISIHSSSGPPPIQ